MKLTGAQVTRIEEALKRASRISNVYIVAEGPPYQNKAHRVPRHVAIEELLDDIQSILAHVELKKLEDMIDAHNSEVMRAPLPQETLSRQG